MLYIFGGLPGAGKTTLATALARHLKAVYLRIDTIEQKMRDTGLVVDGPAGYMVAYGLAGDNLRLGLDVVADSVNPLEITRQAWREVAQQAGVPFFEIEVRCALRDEHRARIQTRKPDIPGLQLPSWDDVLEREYHYWNTEHIIIDTSCQSHDQSFRHLLDLMNEEMLRICPQDDSS